MIGYLVAAGASGAYLSYFFLNRAVTHGKPASSQKSTNISTLKAYLALQCLLISFLQATVPTASHEINYFQKEFDFDFDSSGITHIRQ